MHVTGVAGPRAGHRISNAFGTKALAIGAARIAIRASEAIAADIGRTLAFSGRTAFEIPARAVAVVNDPVTLRVPAFTRISPSITFSTSDTGAEVVTIHRSAHQTSYLSAAGNHVGAMDSGRRKSHGVFPA